MSLSLRYFLFSFKVLLSLMRETFWEIICLTPTWYASSSYRNDEHNSLEKPLVSFSKSKLYDLIAPLLAEGYYAVNMGQPMVLTRNQGCLWPPSTCTAVANWLLNLIIRKKRGREDDMILFQVSNFPTHRSDAKSSNIRWYWDNKLDVPKNKEEEDTYKTIDQQTIRYSCHAFVGQTSSLETK